MRCPFCGHPRDRVVDTREAAEGTVIRRRRMCVQCEKRFTTYERLDEIPLMVVKKSGTREAFDRSKLLNGLLKACEKRPVTVQALEDIVDGVEQRLTANRGHEITTQEIGRMLMDSLVKIDKVAYLRFASVYLEFDDLGEFMKEINQLFDKQLPEELPQELTEKLPGNRSLKEA
ncbi:MAG TPA: transcriptional regulator NrdR [Acidobacteriota bacterium]|nr:transcriptional regulator NrdR [Acidobacteriota bacterium]